MASSSLQNSATVQTQCYILLNLSFELREKIFIHAVILSDGVYPRQRDSAPEKFTYTYANRLDGRQYAKEEPPTAIQLGSACKQLFEEVIKTNLFYKHNEFRFMDPVFAHTYLKKITPSLKMLIQSIYLEIDYIYTPTQAINLISTCKGLKNLRLFYDYYDLHPENVGWESLLRIRGLESFAVMINPNRQAGWVESGRAGSPKNMALLVEAKGVSWERHIDHVKHEVLRPRTEENDRKAEEAVADDCYCPQSLLLHTEGEAVGCDCKDPEFLLATKDDREYRGNGSCGNPYRRAVDLDTDFPEDHLPRARRIISIQAQPVTREVN